ncbi:hypothetical protein ACWGI8_14605 [Streptomyces sp. NPDC054841]
MFAYELQKIQHAEMIRRADNERLARRVRVARRAARLDGTPSAKDEPEGQVSGHGLFARAA